MRRSESIWLYHVRIPLRKRIKHASHVRTDTENHMVVCIRLADGTSGFGEGVPRDYVTGETIDASMSLLRNMDRAPIQADCGSFEEAVRLADALTLSNGSRRRSTLSEQCGSVCSRIGVS